MKKWITNKIFIIILVVLTISGLSKLIDKWGQDERIATNPVLTQVEKSKVIIDARSKKVTTVNRKGEKQVIKTSVGSRHTVITVTNEGEIKTYAPNKGFVFEPGIMLGTDEHNSLLGLDAQVFYWSRFGVLGGASAPPRKGLRLQDLRAHVGIGYVLDQLKMPNTNIFVGYNTKRLITFGARISF